MISSMLMKLAQKFLQWDDDYHSSALLNLSRCFFPSRFKFISIHVRPVNFSEITEAINH